MVVTLTGANDLLRRRELARLVAVFEQEYGSMAIERFDGEEATPGRMRESIQSMPFLSPRKLVLLREPGKQKAFAEAIKDVLANIPETTDLILYEPKLDKRGLYYKTLKKESDFREFAELDAPHLAIWSEQYCKEQGGSLAPADAKLLVDRLGTNQFMLRNELDKLLAYDPRITTESIRQLTEPLPQSTVFELLDAAFAGKAQRVSELYGEQRALRVEPQAIIAMLAWQLHVLAVVKAAGARTADQIAKDAKLSSFVIRKSQSTVRRLTLARIKQLISELLALDLQLKRSSIDADEALQLYLLRLTNN